MKNFVQQMRWEKNWSQAQLARICQVSQSTICDIESERRTPSLDTAMKLARALSTTVDELFKR